MCKNSGLKIQRKGRIVMQQFQVSTQVSNTAFERGASPAVFWQYSSSTGSVHELQVPWEAHDGGLSMYVQSSGLALRLALGQFQEREDNYL